MKSTVYICRDCPTCERIVDHIKENNVKCEVVNISEGGKKAPRISIFPALYVEDKLMAYGVDIIEKIN